MKQSFTAIAALLVGLAAAEHAAHGRVHRHQHTKRNGQTIWVTVTDTVVNTHTSTVWVDASDPTPEVKAKSYGEGQGPKPLDYNNFKKQKNPLPNDQTKPKLQDRPQKHEELPVDKAPTYVPPKDQAVKAVVPDTIGTPFDPIAWQAKQVEIQQGHIREQQANIDKQNGYATPQKEQPPVAPVIKDPVAPIIKDPVAPIVKDPVAPIVKNPVTPTGGSPGGSKLNSVPGIMTFYDPYGAPGACGWSIAQDAPEVALAASMMGDKAKCGQMITIKGPHGSFPAKVSDKCKACEDDFKLGLNRIDVPRAYAAKISGFTFTTESEFEKSKLWEAGHLSDVTWEWA